MSAQPINVDDEDSGTGRRLPFRQSLLAILGLCFVTILVGLDQSIVGTAMPTIAAELNSFDLYAWVGTSYLLASVITVPIFGRLGDFYGRKPFVIASIVIFTTASILSGLADNMLHLILSRALQGVGGGMLVGTAFACIPDLFPVAAVRLKWQVFLSSSYGIASVVGPSLGGFLTEYYGWRSIFFVNVPISLLGLWFVWQYLPLIRYQHKQAIRLDWIGAVLITLALGSLQLFVELLGRYGMGWEVVTLGLLFVLFTLFLIKWEAHCPYALIPLELFRLKSLNVLFLLSLLLGFTLFSLLFYIPLFLQGGFALSPNEAGMLITPLVVCVTVGSILSGRIVTRLSRPNHILYVGFVLVLACILGTIFSNRGGSSSGFVVYMVAGGVGLGMIMPNLTIFSQEVAGKSNLGIATALVQSVRMIGGMLGIAIVGSLVNYFYATGMTRQTSGQISGESFPALYDPQLLVNPAQQADLQAQVHQSGGGDIQVWIEAGRDTLIAAIHSGFWIVFALTLLATVWVYRLPLIDLKGNTTDKQEGV
ncbi:MFS transporter [Advenella sp. RU8]|uniref:MFS transporter n=1 Tax=Advenella sp. RU8 TaxID=3399575 RepID=UPI003AB03135